MSDCEIPTVFCGTAERKYPFIEGQNKYTRQGTPHECLRKGYGAASSKKKNLPKGSLQTIRYVGPVFEKKFQDASIENLRDLHRTADEGSDILDPVLRLVFQNSKGRLDGRGYNSTIMYLRSVGYDDLPTCEKLDDV